MSSEEFNKREREKEREKTLAKSRYVLSRIKKSKTSAPTPSVAITSQAFNQLKAKYVPVLSLLLEQIKSHYTKITGEVNDFNAKWDKIEEDTLNDSANVVYMSKLSSLRDYGYTLMAIFGFVAEIKGCIVLFNEFIDEIRVVSQTSEVKEYLSRLSNNAVELEKMIDDVKCQLLFVRREMSLLMVIYSQESDRFKQMIDMMLLIRPALLNWFTAFQPKKEKSDDNEAGECDSAETTEETDLLLLALKTLPLKTSQQSLTRPRF
jgi:hypothetical protein